MIPMFIEKNVLRVHVIIEVFLSFRIPLSSWKSEIRRQMSFYENHLAASENKDTDISYCDLDKNVPGNDKISKKIFVLANQQDHSNVHCITYQITTCDCRT